ncbi:NAD(P)H-binding protein [Amycolatopsis rhabdoformis]|uniref:NAD(P)H-binding protein n=1 Tax=Amycolatopsis rhabdoformis TaxID=1448059 RepID=A0ABZ1I606_9PSEU|nr:NAD(P)H-binding protein [Amycolatopsis rhabdoformis]WSE29720.1 NAD(P)H-binding protein [Amycolatopsis rhabdoformis]
MKVLLFGATGMVGQGVLRECLLDERVEHVLTVGRTATGTTHPKLTELVPDDLSDLSPHAEELANYDACLFCLGVSSAGMPAAEYERITYGLTLSVARTYAAARPNARFLYVSGAGTDSTERGRVRWARVKGATENAVARLPLDAYAIRPGFIQPQHGVTSKTPLYRRLYRITAPLYPLLQRFPAAFITTEVLGRAMLSVAADGFPRHILESRDLNDAGQRDRPGGSPAPR